MQIRPYLYFNGECADAIALYKRAFGGEVTMLMRYCDAPPNPAMANLPDAFKDRILQAMLQIGDNVIRLSDSMGQGGNAPGERVAIVVECTAEEVKRAFEALCEGGNVGMPLQQTFFSPCYGIVIDKFGVMWNLAAA